MLSAGGTVEKEDKSMTGLSPKDRDKLHLEIGRIAMRYFGEDILTGLEKANAAKDALTVGLASPEQQQYCAELLAATIKAVE